jgi:hypothetical protein
MPLRRWFIEHGRPAWWSWVTVGVMVVGSLGLFTVITLRAVDRAVDAERAARIEGIRATCLAAAAQEKVFSEAETDVGRNARKAWHDLRVTLRCDEE